MKQETKEMIAGVIAWPLAMVMGYFLVAVGKITDFCYRERGEHGRK